MHKYNWKTSRIWPKLRSLSLSLSLHNPDLLIPDSQMQVFLQLCNMMFHLPSIFSFLLLIIICLYIIIAQQIHVHWMNKGIHVRINKWVAKSKKLPWTSVRIIPFPSLHGNEIVPHLLYQHLNLHHILFNLINQIIF